MGRKGGIRSILSAEGFEDEHMFRTFAYLPVIYIRRNLHRPYICRGEHIEERRSPQRKDERFFLSRRLQPAAGAVLYLLKGYRRRGETVVQDIASQTQPGRALERKNNTLRGKMTTNAFIQGLRWIMPFFFSSAPLWEGNLMYFFYGFCRGSVAPSSSRVVVDTRSK